MGWMRKWGAAVVVSAVVLAACGTDGDTDPTGPPVPGDQPTLDAFVRPFAGDFPLGNFFDHDTPLGFVGTPEANDWQVNFRGNRSKRLDGHAGYDWLMPVGTPITAVADGRVDFVGAEAPFECGVQDRIVDDQLLVSIAHRIDGNTYTSVYVHLSEFQVELGHEVKQGDPIGLSGNTGCSTDPHLHFQVWRFTNTNNGRPTPIDPYGWSSDDPDPWAEHPRGATSLWLWAPDQAPWLDPAPYL